MIRSYMLVAFRNLKREKVYSLLNIIGLAVGIASVLVIYRYIQFERSYDTFHSDYRNIFRLSEEFEDDARRVQSAMGHAPVADALSQKIIGLKHVVRVFPQSAIISSDPQTKYREDRFCFADSLFFETFSFEVIEGSLHGALLNPFSVVLTKGTAIKYFGKSDVIGKELVFEDESNSYRYAITAVIEDIPQNSHFNFNFIASFSTLDKVMPWYNNWNHPPMYVYLKKESAISEASLGKQINAVIRQHQPDEVKEEKRRYTLQPIADIHLHSNLEFEWEANSNFQYVRIFVLLGAFILVIACINFMNMATAQASRRSREIGVRKVFGGIRSQLVWQFLSETFLYVAISFAGGVVLTELALRFMLNGVIQKNLTLLSFFAWPNWILALMFVLALSFLAGIYPSVYLSRFRPSQIIRGNVIGLRNKTNLRKGLVTFQFIVSCLMISATVVISAQLSYLKNKNLGFDRDHIVTIKLTDRYAQKNYAVLKDELLATSGVVDAGLSSALPGKGNFHGFDIRPEHSKNVVQMKTLGVDEDFIRTYRIPVLKGRDFSKEIATDQTDAFVLNKAAALKLGWPDPVGKELELTVNIAGPVRKVGKVVGLIDNFHFQSLHNEVEPLLLYINKHPYYAEYLSVRMRPGNLSQTVSILEEHWKSFHPDKPFEYHFLEDDLNQLYKTELKMSQIFTTLTLVAIVISGLGLFALSSYSAARRAKEMSIRKVFGASMGTILSLQFREYGWIILTANVIVLPVCWYWANDWLQNFAYHIDVELYVFLLTFVSSFLLALGTVGFHSLQLARNNPTDTMRHE